MSMETSNSLNRNDYEILIRRRGENEYASYCPQLNIMLTGSFHEEVENKMEEYIKNHIENLKKSKGVDPEKN